MVRTEQVPAENLNFAAGEHRHRAQRRWSRVNKDGTGARVFAGAPYTSAGKTGTAQAVAMGRTAPSTTPRRWKSTSATTRCSWPSRRPRTPKIAIAVIVENAGFGAANAAPIVRRVFDYWLLNQYPNEEDLAAVQIGKAGHPDRQAAAWRARWSGRRYRVQPLQPAAPPRWRAHPSVCYKKYSALRRWGGRCSPI